MAIGDKDNSYIISGLSLIHISEPTRQAEISYAVFCLKKKKNKKKQKKQKKQKNKEKKKKTTSKKKNKPT